MAFAAVLRPGGPINLWCGDSTSVFGCRGSRPSRLYPSLKIPPWKSSGKCERASPQAGDRETRLSLRDSSESSPRLDPRVIMEGSGNRINHHPPLPFHPLFAPSRSCGKLITLIPTREGEAKTEEKKPLRAVFASGEASGIPPLGFSRMIV